MTDEAATAVLTDAKGTSVQIVGADGAVDFARVVIERDSGPTVYVADGIDPGDRVVKVASAELSEGLHVDIAR